MCARRLTSTLHRMLRSALTSRRSRRPTIPGGRPFALLLSSLAVSSCGDWLYNVALLAFVYQRTGSPTWVAITTAARVIPMVALGPLGGVLADRCDRRRLIIASDLTRGALMVALAGVAAAGLPIVLAPAARRGGHRGRHRAAAERGGEHRPLRRGVRASPAPARCAPRSARPRSSSAPRWARCCCSSPTRRSRSCSTGSPSPPRRPRSWRSTPVRRSPRHSAPTARRCRA